MGKLQYDSFYKFLVSAGLILITAPFVGLYYVLINNNQILMPGYGYDAVSDSSMITPELSLVREKTLVFSLKIIPWISIAFLVIGFACLLFGSWKWYQTQQELDKQEQLRTTEQQVKIKQLSPEKVAERTIAEVDESHE